MKRSGRSFNQLREAWLLEAISLNPGAGVALLAKALRASAPSMRITDVRARALVFAVLKDLLATGAVVVVDGGCRLGDGRGRGFVVDSPALNLPPP